jgi:nitroimidazol reductase NimA-like FMN-containing flavoprotein (pyridoxamine 5'-phosphate oxidase superfamily)
VPPDDVGPPLRWLDRAACDELLAAEEVGRLAVVAGGAPMIFVVNYVMDGDDIVFRSDSGTKVDQGPRARACFQIDHIDREHKTGWSVVATGRLDEVTKYDAERWERVTKLPLSPWAGGAKAHWMRLVTNYVSGRRVG